MSGEATFLKRWPPRFSVGGDCRILAGCVAGSAVPSCAGSERRTLTPSSAASRGDVAAEVGCLLRQRPGGVRAP